MWYHVILLLHVLWSVMFRYRIGGSLGGVSWDSPWNRVTVRTKRRSSTVSPSPSQAVWLRWNCRASDCFRLLQTASDWSFGFLSLEGIGYFLALRCLKQAKKASSDTVDWYNNNIYIYNIYIYNIIFMSYIISDMRKERRMNCELLV